MSHSHSSPRMVVRGALALEVVPGTQPGRDVISREDASSLASYVGEDLATVVSEARRLDLVLAGGHYDPAEVLRPGWPMHQRLQELHARAPRDATPSDSGRVIAFGADDRGDLPQPLRGDTGLQGGPLRIVPWLLVGDAETISGVAAHFEDALLERGMAWAATALLAQDAFEARIEHARHLTLHDLLAMMAMQYRHVGLDLLWTVLETALLAPEESVWLDAPPEPLMHYTHGQVRVAGFGRDAWQRHYGIAYTDDVRLSQAFTRFQMRERQLVAILKVHGIDVQRVRCDDADDARARLA